MPSNFQFAFKGTDRITIKKFPNLPRYGHRADVVNENFLNAEFFSNAFLRPCDFSNRHQRTPLQQAPPCLGGGLLWYTQNREASSFRTKHPRFWGMALV